jgi:hypothetical protein
VIDPGTNKVTATLSAGSALEVGRADGQGNVWVILGPGARRRKNPPSFDLQPPTSCTRNAP